LNVDILTIGEWERATLLADSFRRGRVFLAGDATHRVTPAGAFGMNTAIQTAQNLAWKLAAVVQGWAGPGLLDTYECERRPWTAQTVELSLRLHDQGPRAAANTLGHVLGSAYPTGAFVPDGSPTPEVHDAIAQYVPSARPGRRAPHVWLPGSNPRTSTIDLFDGRFVLLSPSEGWCRTALDAGHRLAVPMAAHVITDPGWASAYDVGPDGAVLVRPDGHVAWRNAASSENRAGELSQVLSAVLDLEGSASVPRQAPVTTAL
jgi:hypothetical protein